MVVEEPPRLRPATEDRENDWRALLKTPPREEILCRTIDPVGLKPGFDVFMTRDGDEFLPALADGLRQRGTADLCHGAIDHACVFVHYCQIRTVGEHPGQANPELLSGGEDSKGPQPGRRTGEAD